MKSLRYAVLSAALACTPAFAGADAGIAAALTAQQGKRVTLQLRSGQELTGTVQSVSDGVVKLGELAGKEFFDATVRVEGVDAVVVRAR